MCTSRSNDARLTRITEARDAVQTFRHTARERFALAISEGHREGLTYAEIGRHLGISRERVRQIAATVEGEST
ncbi:sigma factor-like helix-turn-helix DNA-binding protein [Mycobacteroides abscessus]|uniref:sigma factor-like helix-turn-helix DNA-binding protein n=1 Tax=Mycobacteroides abscessus TaxID=36809 RepID=UPI000C268021|nr:sigma factor-like helix-turn-helix DNA-binding protein [Mycobacteroides abscessus]